MSKSFVVYNKEQPGKDDDLKYVLLPLAEETYAIELAEIAVWALKQIAAAIAQNELGKILGSTKDEWKDYIGDRLGKIESGIDEIIYRLQNIGIRLEHIYDDGVKKEINSDLYGYKNSFLSVLSRINRLDQISPSDMEALVQMSVEVERLGFKSLTYGQHCYPIAIYSFGLLASIYQVMAATEKRYINSLSSAASRFLPEFKAMLDSSIEKSIKQTLDSNNTQVVYLTDRVVNIYTRYKRFALAFHHILLPPPGSYDTRFLINYYKLIPGIIELSADGFVSHSDWQGNSSPYTFKPENRDHEGLSEFPEFPAPDVSDDQASWVLLARVVDKINHDASALSQGRKTLAALQSDISIIESFIVALKAWA